MNGDKSATLHSLEMYRSYVDDASLSVSEGMVPGAYKSALGALMHLLNFADTWYASQGLESGGPRNTNLNISDDRLSILIHLLLSRRICDLSGKVVSFNVQNRLLTRDTILCRVLANRKISDTSAALLFRLENFTAAFRNIDEGGGEPVTTPEGFPDKMPDSLSFIDTPKNVGYSELVGVDEQVTKLQKLIEASRLAKTSTMAMLYGPPGTGKTSLVVAAARENNLPLVTVTTSNLGGEFIGEREQNTADMYDYLEKVKTDYILFVDEADSFLPEKYESNTQSRLVRVLTINRMLHLVGHRDGVTRLVMLASNYADMIARDVADSCVKLYLAPPSTYDQMRDLISFYRKRANINVTHAQLDFLTRTARSLNYAPGHVSLLIQRLLTNSLIQLLNNKAVLQIVRTGVLQQPVFKLEHNRRFEPDNATVTVVRMTNEPRRTEVDAVTLGRENNIAFPVPDLNVDYGSVSGRQIDVNVATPPTIESEFGPIPPHELPLAPSGVAIEDVLLASESETTQHLYDDTYVHIFKNILYSADPGSGKPLTNTLVGVDQVKMLEFGLNHRVCNVESTVNHNDIHVLEFRPNHATEVWTLVRNVYEKWERLYENNGRVYWPCRSQAVDLVIDGTIDTLRCLQPIRFLKEKHKLAQSLLDLLLVLTSNYFYNLLDSHDNGDYLVRIKRQKIRKIECKAADKAMDFFRTFDPDRYESVQKNPESCGYNCSVKQLIERFSKRDSHKFSTNFLKKLSHFAIARVFTGHKDQVHMLLCHRFLAEDPIHCDSWLQLMLAVADSRLGVFDAQNRLITEVKQWKRTYDLSGRKSAKRKRGVIVEHGVKTAKTLDGGALGGIRITGDSGPGDDSDA
ncbi:Pan1p [Homalodisca vitripennis]|nr:Pan1p [Homalodisca vitripennis]